ncbi:MAG: cation transporter [Nitrospirae bacterium]|nr:cation transporter [Nitrospirota bacterium]
MPATRHHHGAHAVNTEHRRRFSIVLAITFAFLLIEAVGGWITGSLALLADASHLLGDVGALSLSLVAMWLVGRPATHAKTYGYHRAEILAALFNGLLLWLIAGLIWHEAYQRLLAPVPIHGTGMTVIAALGLGANLASYFFLSSMPQHTLNTRTAMLHLLGDTLGSVGALTAGLIIWSTGWTSADPLVSFLIGGLILVTSWGVMKESIDVLMEGTPKEIDLGAIMTALGGVQGLQEVHDLHVWCLRSGVHALTMHGVIGEEVDDAAILTAMTHLLGDRFNIHHTTIQLDRRPGLVQIKR